MFSQFYLPLLGFHNVLRWVALLAGVIALAVAFSGWSGARQSNRLLLRCSILFVIAMDLQFLLGLVLYFGASPLTQQAFQDMGAAMKVRDLRFFTVEHTVLAFLAIVLAHLGAALARKSQTVLAQHRRAAICFALSLLVLLIGIPWWRPLLRFGS